MSDMFKRDRTCTAIIWLKNGKFWEVAEENWPADLGPHDPDRVVRVLSLMLGLDVTLKTTETCTYRSDT